MKKQKTRNNKKQRHMKTIYIAYHQTEKRNNIRIKCRIGKFRHHIVNTPVCRIHADISAVSDYNQYRCNQSEPVIYTHSFVFHRNSLSLFHLLYGTFYTLFFQVPISSACNSFKKTDSCAPPSFPFHENQRNCLARVTAT